MATELNQTNFSGIECDICNSTNIIDSNRENVLIKKQPKTMIEPTKISSSGPHFSAVIGESFRLFNSNKSRLEYILMDSVNIAANYLNQSKTKKTRELLWKNCRALEKLLKMTENMPQTLISAMDLLRTDMFIKSIINDSIMQLEKEN